MILLVFLLIFFAIVLLINNGTNIDEIKSKYSDLDIDLKDGDKYTEIKISKNINIITPGLNLILGNPYKVIVERVIPNDEA